MSWGPKSKAPSRASPAQDLTQAYEVQWLNIQSLDLICAYQLTEPRHHPTAPIFWSYVDQLLYIKLLYKYSCYLPHIWDGNVKGVALANFLPKGATALRAPKENLMKPSARGWDYSKNILHSLCSFLQFKAWLASQGYNLCKKARQKAERNITENILLIWMLKYFSICIYADIILLTTFLAIFVF